MEGRPAALAAEADVLITMLPGPGEVHGVMAGPGGGELLAVALLEEQAHSVDRGWIMD